MFSRTQNPIIEIYLGTLQPRYFPYLPICFIKLHLNIESLYLLFCMYLFYFISLLLCSLAVNIHMMNFLQE